MHTTKQDLFDWISKHTAVNLFICAYGCIYYCYTI